MTPQITYEGQAAPVPANPLPYAQGAYGGSGYVEPSETGSGIREMFNGLLQHAPLIAGAGLAAIALALLYLLFAEPVYRIDSLVQVDDRKPPPGYVTNLQQANAMQPPANPVLGEIEVLRSRELVQKAAQAAGLDVDIAVDNRMPLVGGLYARWWQAQNPGSATAAAAPLGLSHFSWGGERLQLAKFEVPPSRLEEPFSLRLLETGRNARWQLADASGERVAEGRVGTPTEFMLDGRPAVLEVAEVRGLPGVTFELKKHSLGALYEDLTRALQISEATRSSNVIRLSYDSSERQRAVRLLEALTAGYVDRTVERRTAEAEQSLKFLETQLPELKRKLESSEQALSQFRGRTNTLNVDQETQSSLGRMAMLERDRVMLQMKAQELSQRYLPSHPELQAVNQQRRVVDAELERLNRSSNALPSNQREFVRLQREVETSAALYTTLLASSQELKLARASMIPTARVVDPPAATEKPIRPKPLLVLAIASVLGLIGGIVIAFVRGQLRPTVQDADDIESSTGLMTLAYIPESPGQKKLSRWSMLPRQGKPQLLALHAPSEPAVESLRSFRSNLTLPSSRQIEKTVLIAAPTAGLGKTFVAANLAALLAAANRSVLLIDADLRKPRLHRYFRAPAAPGLAEVLNGEMEFKDVVRVEAAGNLDLLLAGRARRNPADLLLSPKLRELLDSLEKRYDCIVIDSPPVLPVADALAFAHFGLQTFLVARSEVSTVREIREAARRLDGVGGRVQGVLFNGVKRARFGNLGYYAYGDA
jgi:tyrosine-protein kinase Etk/Wzc